LSLLRRKHAHRSIGQGPAGTLWYLMKRMLLAAGLVATAASAWSMDYTNGFALTTPDGHHIGAMLASPSFKAEKGDCVFLLIPVSPAAVSSRLGILVSGLKGKGELHWRKQNGAIVVPNDGAVLLTILPSGEVADTSGTIIGSAIAIPE